MPRLASTTVTCTLVAAMALLLGACGSGDDASPAGSAKSTGAKAKAKADPGGPTDAAQRPEITLPSTFQLTFENWTSNDPLKQAVLADAKEELRAGYAAIIANNPDSKDVAFYDSEGVVGQTRAWIRTYTDKNLTVLGKLPAFAPKVVLGSNKRAAVVSYCTDESKAYTKNRKTGEKLGNPEGTSPYVSYSISFAKNAQGVWQNTSQHGKRGACSR
ncbi:MULTISPECIES: hypothetical protein [unclassified Streptomyces]|uniref:hypothetical protein n=2 Tax=Streptomyces TaxID=1883 RepID=UPI000D34C785|nr:MULTISPECIES: hypothetical protein [unclassified Streptomyces]MBY8340220.1 hypothetical protein [Streptomyces plumbidurans]PTM88968.1 hypothetical protein C7821_113126 [Streptomyces sp. VMFN-G11Ma]